MCGVYKITNKVNNKVYVGQSIDIKRRWHDHKIAAFSKNNAQFDAPLYRAMRKYGIENFSFTVLEECDQNDLDQKERDYIKKHNSHGNNGYNQTDGGSGFENKPKLSREIVAQIIDRLKSSIDNSEKIGQDFGVSSHSIRAINRGVVWRVDDEHYPIREHLASIKRENNHTLSSKGKISKTKHARHVETENESKCVVFDPSLALLERPSYCSHCVKIEKGEHGRPCPLLIAELVSKNGFEAVGRKYKVTGSAIKKWCKFYQIPHKRKELLLWYNKQFNITPIQISPTQRKQTMRCVRQIDPHTHDTINIFKSIGEAARFIGHPNNPSHISDVCYQKSKTAYGFMWEFVD